MHPLLGAVPPVAEPSLSEAADVRVQGMRGSQFQAVLEQTENGLIWVAALVGEGPGRYSDEVREAVWVSIDLVTYLTFFIC